MSKEITIAVDFCLRCYTAKVCGYYVWGITEEGEEYRQILYEQERGKVHRNINKVITDETMKQNYDYQQLVELLKDKHVKTLLEEYLHAVAMHGPVKSTDIDIRRFKIYGKFYDEILDALKDKAEILKHKFFAFVVERENIQPFIHDMMTCGFLTTENVKLVLNPLFDAWQIASIVDSLKQGLTAQEMSVVARPDLERGYINYTIEWMVLYKTRYGIDSEAIQLFNKLVNNSIEYRWSNEQWDVADRLVKEVIATGNKYQTDQQILQLIQYQNHLTENIDNELSQK